MTAQESIDIEPGAELSPNVCVEIDLPFECDAQLLPTPAADVKAFCASSNYRARYLAPGCSIEELPLLLRRSPRLNQKI